MSSDRIDEAAARWLARLLSPDCSEREHEAFEAWCAADPAHADAYAAVAQHHFEAAALKDDERMRAAARAARYATSARSARWSAWPERFAAAALLMLAIAAGVLWIANGRKPELVHYATAIGEQRRVELADGTALQLDTDTDVRVRYASDARELTLERGRVRIDVAPDAQRPFSLRSGRSLVRDIGTQFQVARYAGEVTVTLLSGIVSVALADQAATEPRVLAPGEELRVEEQGALGWPTRVDLQNASDWTRGVLTFKERRLGDLLEEMNRYSETKIRLADPELSALTVSGVFRVGDQHSLLQALQTGWSIRARHVSEREILLLPAK